jgi:hypothetical protein
MVNVLNQIIIPIVLSVTFIIIFYYEQKHPKYKWYRDSKGRFRRRRIEK